MSYDNRDAPFYCPKCGGDTECVNPIDGNNTKCLFCNYEFRLIRKKDLWRGELNGL